MQSDKPKNWKETVCYFENTKPENYLLSLSEGSPPLPAIELLAIERARNQYKLPDGVITVLLDFLLKTNDLRFDTNLFYEIALHWSRKRIDNVRSAMSQARNEFKERKKLNDQEGNRNNSKLEKEINDFMAYIHFKENAPPKEKQAFELFKKYLQSVNK